MRRVFTRWGVLTLTWLALAGPARLEAGADTDADADAPHITLDESAPADGATISDDVTEIRLFFSEAPLMRGASVRIVTSSRSLMRSTPPAPDTEDPRQLFVRVDPALPAGAYVVQWRCIADDGHVMRGDFTFEVAAE